MHISPKVYSFSHSLQSDFYNDLRTSDVVQVVDLPVSFRVFSILIIGLQVIKSTSCQEAMNGLATS